MKAEIQDFNGTPTIFLDGAPVTGLMHWTRCPSVEDTELFRSAGVHFYSFMGNLAVAPPEPVRPEELEIRDGGLERLLLSPENIDRVMEMLVGVDPEIKVLPRIIMNPPVWWEKRHPEELMVYYNFLRGEYVHGPRACLTSELWNALWQNNLRRTIGHFEAKWGDFIFGYHTGLADCGEHDYKWWDNAADFSAGQLRAFRLWLAGRYGSIDVLNRVWNSRFDSFDAIPLPAGERFADFGPRANSLYLPETESDLIDFQKFASDRMADTLLLEARTVKDELRKLGRTKLFGAFYGYINLVANSTQSTVGHSSLTRVLDSPDVDFLCGPLSYGARQNGGVSLPQMIPDSIALRGKLFYNEDDTGTHVYHGAHHGYLPATAEDSWQAARRNFLATWSSGGTLWWMDLYGKGWFLSPELQKEFAFLRNFAEAHFADRRGSSEIAVFVSLKSSLYLRDTPLPLTGNLIEQQLFEIASCGAPFDLFQDEDIPLLAKSGRLGPYKLCIFLNLVAPEEPVREAIETYLKKDGRTLLWFYAPGYIRNDRRDAEAAGALTGIHFSAVESGIMPMLTETWFRGVRLSYGLTRAVYPRLSADDPEAENLGYFVNGTTIAGQPHGSGAAFAAKGMPGWRSVWSASPGMPSCILGELAARSGVHLYTERGDQVFRGPGWLGVHAKCDGPLELSLPGRFRCRNLVNGEEFPPSATLSLLLKRGETALFELEDVF